MTARTPLLGLTLALGIAFAAQAAPAPAETALPVHPAQDKPLALVKLTKATWVAEDSHAFLTYAAPAGLTFCVSMATTDDAVIAPRPMFGTTPPVGGVAWEGARTRCTVGDKAGEATVDVWVRHRDGLLLASIVLVSGEVHTDVVTLPPEPKRRR